MPSKSRIHSGYVSDKVHDQGPNGTCYAYAIASAIRRAQSLKKEKLTSHRKIRNRLIRKYGRDGAHVCQVLEEQSRKYNITFKKTSSREKAEEALRRKQGLIIRCSLTEKQWHTFEKFFKANPRETLHKSDLGASNPGKSTSGHAMIVYGQTKDCWIVKNSWGKGFANHGLFTIRKNAMKFRFVCVK